METRMRKILEEIQRRKDANEDTCDSCSGTGSIAPSMVCADCLGQGVLLTSDEYRALLEVAGIRLDDDSILDEDLIE